MAYKNKEGEIINNFPTIPEDFEGLEPIYETLEGWNSITFGIQKYTELPLKALDYITYIENFIGVKITIISTGADRKHTIVLKDFFD